MSAVRETSPTQIQARRAQVAGLLAASLAPESVLVDRETLKPYECDGLSAYRETPLVAVIPASEAEVAVVMRVARDTGTPVVPRGSGTGLSGGALPLRDGILLSMAKFNRIVEVDVLARTRRMLCTVRPYLRQCTPPEFSATLPPMEQAIWLEGSGA